MSFCALLIIMQDKSNCTHNSGSGPRPVRSHNWMEQGIHLGKSLKLIMTTMNKHDEYERSVEILSMTTMSKHDEYGRSVET